VLSPLAATKIEIEWAQPLRSNFKKIFSKERNYEKSSG